MTWIIILLFVALWGAFNIARRITPVPVTWRGEEADQRYTDTSQIFGDLAGTFVSTIALIMLIRTIRQQNEALDIQEEGLQLTRKQLTDAQEETRNLYAVQKEQTEIARLSALLNAHTALLQQHEKRLDGYKQNASQRNLAEQRTWDAVERAVHDSNRRIQEIMQRLEKYD